jgi:hypothetical protein
MTRSLNFALALGLADIGGFAEVIVARNLAEPRALAKRARCVIGAMPIVILSLFVNGQDRRPRSADENHTGAFVYCATPPESGRYIKKANRHT